MKLHFNPGKRNPSVWLPANIEGVRLEPGVNEIDEETLLKIRQNNTYKVYEAQGCFKIEYDQEQSTTTTSQTKGEEEQPTTRTKQEEEVTTNA